MKKSKRKPNILSRWHNLAQPHKGYLAGQIIFYIGYTIFLSLLTIFAAKTINCIYNSQWKNAFFYLGLELLTILIRNVSLHIQYVYYGKQSKHIRMVVSEKIYDKLLSCKSSSIKEMSSEKIINIALNNLSNLSSFADNISTFIAYGVQIIFILTTVFISNYIAGIIVLIIGVINFFAYYNFNKKLGRLMLKRHEQKDQIYHSYMNLITSKSLISELRKGKKFKKEFLGEVAQFGDEYKQYYNVVSYKENLYFGFWNVLVYAITALMLYFVSHGQMPITIYLIIIPYLTSCTEKLNKLFDQTNSLENMRVDVDRINLILNLTDNELIEYGKINADDSVYNLGLIDVNYKNPNKQSECIKEADISFKMEGINVIKGARNSGKRVIFDLLRRFKKPDSGIILLDNLNLYDYNVKTFKNHIDYCTAHPYFINGTIKENFIFVNKNMRKIKEVCKEIGILNLINKLPNGFNTKIDEISSSSTLFMLGLARAMLSNSNILMVYEIPQDTDEQFRKKIVKTLTNIKNKTLILFTHTSIFDDIANLIYKVENKTVKIEKTR